MRPTVFNLRAAVLLAALLTVANRGRAQTPPLPTSRPVPNAEGVAKGIAKARADSARLPYTTADIRFMTGMIAHHAQAISMSRWANSHGANAAVQTLCKRIINAQQDDIALMQQWLRERRQPVPDPAAPMANMPMNMSGMDHAMDHGPMMPGMLTDAQMKSLDAARGEEFDRLFLSFMIQHHQGAVSMVKELFATPGAGQDETTFKFASDVNVDQTTEITRMQDMLIDVISARRTP